MPLDFTRTHGLVPLDDSSSLSLHDLAALIRELFGEGSLSWEQLCALADLPDLAPFLSEAVARAPACRRPLAAE